MQSKMPIYFCGVCEYTTESKSSMDKHKARKRPCTVADRPVKQVAVPPTNNTSINKE